MLFTVVTLLVCRIFCVGNGMLLAEGAAVVPAEAPEDYLHLSSSPEPGDNSLDYYNGNAVSEVVLDEMESNDLMLDNTTVEESLTPGNESLEDESHWLDQNRKNDKENRSLIKGKKRDLPVLRDPLVVVIPVTFIFALILLIGLVGNVSTCVVIAKNNYMHTATNYYLFSLAVSDLLLLISGLPQEMYLIWLKWPYIFGEAFCLIRGLAAETSANATVLTITAFTVERYVAICHPLRSHKLSQLSRVITIILLIWIFALVFALPQAAQFGVIDEMDYNGRVLIEGAWCTIKRKVVPYAFEISICVFFVVPMTMITVLYVLIGLKLRRSRGPSRTNRELSVEPRNTNRHSQSHVIRMLVAVVVAFFICWAPFHIQRLMAIYSEWLGLASSFSLRTLYKIINYVSGVLYYVSTCINPILYHIMSNKFRQAFKDTISHLLGRPTSRIQHRSYSTMSHHRSSRMGVNGHVHHHYQSNGSRRGERQETCINCRHTPIMCSCRGNSQKYVRTYNLEQTGSDATTVSLLSTSPSEKDPVIALASMDSSKGQGRQTTAQLKTEQHSGLRAFISRRGRSQNRAVNGITHKTGGTSSTTQSLLPQTNGKHLNISHEKFNGHMNGKKKNLLGPGSKTTKMMLILRKKKKSRSPSDSSIPEYVIQGQNGLEAGKDLPGITITSRKEVCRAMSQVSVDSNNTISNSSLQDLDEKEYTGEELAEVLAELKESMESPTICKV